MEVFLFKDAALTSNAESFYLWITRHFNLDISRNSAFLRGSLVDPPGLKIAQ